VTAFLCLGVHLRGRNSGGERVVPRRGFEGYESFVFGARGWKESLA